MSQKQVDLYSKPYFNENQMHTICTTFDYLPFEQVKVYAIPIISDYKMNGVLKNFIDGLTIEEVKEKYGL